MSDLERRIAKYWNDRSKGLGQTRSRELHGKNFDLWTDLFREKLSRKNLKILDVGTGAGFFPVILSKLGHRVTGIDASSKMLREAEKNLESFRCRAELRKMNAQSLDFIDESFDIVISRNLTWTLPDVPTAYREWKRVLKIDGMLMNFDSNYGNVKFAAEDFPLNFKTLAECDSIKDSLEISSMIRPEWDSKFLREIGFDVEIDPDISNRVQQDESIPYDKIAVFGIYATRIS